MVYNALAGSSIRQGVRTKGETGSS